ncbi:nuclear transport factor 2 family protein [Heliobacterium chlorum]|uniref:Nuclear transport factor 2 family protein n=1 Tax=Heliobacterium chlorum TaxID=2698 RepID=A0ABR7T2S0_HELCL|nr:DUF4440 domain-containing protein [Heliobacterium chlorum]MBC9785075.1 nuclear transport factor 2 family protein [Heliobacterium chlorum]
MFANSIQEIVELMDSALNKGDIDTLLSFYDHNAIVVLEPGKQVEGKAQLRKAFEEIIKSNSKAKQLKTHVIESDGIALFISKWTLSGADSEDSSYPPQFIATSVFRKQNGQWKLIIDNPFGPAVLA